MSSTHVSSKIINVLTESDFIGYYIISILEILVQPCQNREED